jgi:hypothetical protein
MQSALTEHKKETWGLAPHPAHPRLHALHFAMPDGRGVGGRVPKTRVLAPLKPARSAAEKKRMYIYTTNDTYYHMYACSWFGWTQKKAGWDCQRHYEIMAAGCMPVFHRLETCPLSLFPPALRALWLENNALYARLKDIPLEKWTTHHLAEADALTQRNRRALETHLTCSSLFIQLLEAARWGHAARVGILSTKVPCDYMRDNLIIGAKHVLGQRAACNQAVWWIFDDAKRPMHTLWGKGFTYGRALPACRRSSILEDTAPTRGAQKHTIPKIPKSPKASRTIHNAAWWSAVRAQWFDVILVHWMNRRHFDRAWEELIKHYPPHRIILFCAEDAPPSRGTLKTLLSHGSHVFVRELMLRQTETCFQSP